MQIMTEAPIPATLHGEQLFVWVTNYHCDHCNAIDPWGAQRWKWANVDGSDYCPSCASELLASL